MHSNSVKMKTRTTTITARIDSEKKIAAEEILNDLGMTLSGAINVFFNAVIVNQGIPFPVGRKGLNANLIVRGEAESEP